MDLVSMFVWAVVALAVCASTALFGTLIYIMAAWVERFWDWIYWRRAERTYREMASYQ